MDRSGETFRFCPYELRPKAQQLFKHGVRLRLRPKPFLLLQILLESGGEIVTREELQKRLWTSDTFVDFEHGLNTAVKELRGVLGDSAAEPTYIETLPRVGYRFLPPFEPVAGTASANDLLPSVGSDSSAGTVPTTEEASQNKIGEGALLHLHPERRRIPRWAPVAGTLVMLLILLSVGLSVGYRRGSSRDAEASAGWTGYVGGAAV